MTRSRNIFALPPRADLSERELARLKPRAMSAWIEQLPASGSRATARALFERARILSRSRLPPPQLFESIEILVSRCHPISSGIESHLAAKALPLAREDLRVADLLYKLRLKIFLVYKRVLDDSRAERGALRLLHRGLRRRAFHRAQEILFELLRNRCQVYRAIPYYHWLEIHSNFEQAVSEGRAEWSQPLLSDDSEKLSIAALYKQALLFALAAPQRFRPPEIQRLRLALRRWVDACHLERIGDEIDRQRGPFLVDVNQDRPPVPVAAAEMSHSLAGWYIQTADLAGLVAIEMAEAEQRRNGNMRDRPLARPDQLTPSMLSSLMLAWGMGARRHEARGRCHEAVKAVLGFDDLYAILGGMPLPEDRDDISLDLATVDSAAWKAQAAALEWNSEMAEVEFVGKQNLASPEDVPVHYFLMCDVGAGGMSICAGDASQSAAHVGEMVGVLSDLDSSAVSRIGVIRWMRLDKNNRQQCGVEILIEEPRCSMLRITRKQGAVEYMPVIYQPPAEGREHILLMTKCVFADANDGFCWCFDGQARPLHLSQMLECAGGYSLFQVPVSVDAGSQSAWACKSSNVSAIGCHNGGTS